MRLALRILRPHSLSLISLSLTSLSHISLSHISLSHISLSLTSLSLTSLSLTSLSLSLLSLYFLSLCLLSLCLFSVSRLSVFLLSLLSQEDPGKEPHIKDSSPLPPKRAPCFFVPHCPPLSHFGALAFARPLASNITTLTTLRPLWE